MRVITALKAARQTCIHTVAAVYDRRCSLFSGSPPVIDHRYSVVLCVLIVIATGAAQSTPPQPLPIPASISTPRDVPYPGSIQLNVDATDIDRHIFNVHERIPVRGGESIVLLYPQWLPGNHSPTGRIESLAGLMIHAAGALLQVPLRPRQARLS